jgi:hypothetical protein
VLGVGDGEVLTAVIMVDDQAGQIRVFAAGGPDGLADGVDDEWLVMVVATDQPGMRRA